MKRTPPKSKANQLTRRLIDWFAVGARDVPWRHTLDPYAVWVSEIMLQQTQVKTVVPYFERWMREVPTVEKLSRLSSTRLHKLWEGLGYYTRARNLQKAAQQIVADHGGAFPRRFDNILDLPGIGRYTAGAISSIAFNQPMPLVDGNVIRVLSRIFGVHGDPKDKVVTEQFWDKAGELVAAAGRMRSKFIASNPGLRIAGNCSALNQSLMELGAMVCTPRNANCDACPVSQMCHATRHQLVEVLPEIPQRTRPTPLRFVAFIVRRGSQFMVRQRPSGVVNAHLWEFPNVEVALDEPDPVRAASGQLGLGLDQVERCASVRHSITRYRIALECYRTRGSTALRLPGHEFLTLSQIEKLPFAAAHQKLIRYL